MSDLSEHHMSTIQMQKKFEINRTKIKGTCESGRKVVAHNSKSDLPLSIFILWKIRLGFYLCICFSNDFIIIFKVFIIIPFFKTRLQQWMRLCFMNNFHMSCVICPMCKLTIAFCTLMLIMFCMLGCNMFLKRNKKN